MEVPKFDFLWQYVEHRGIGGSYVHSDEVLRQDVYKQGFQ